MDVLIDSIYEFSDAMMIPCNDSSFRFNHSALKRFQEGALHNCIDYKRNHMPYYNTMMNSLFLNNLQRVVFQVFVLPCKEKGLEDDPSNMMVLYSSLNSPPFNKTTAIHLKGATIGYKYMYSLHKEWILCYKYVKRQKSSTMISAVLYRQKDKATIPFLNVRKV